MPARANEKRDPNTPTIRSIAEEVAAKHNLALNDLLSPYQFDHFVIARHEAMHRCYYKAKRSYQVIGRFFRRDFSTVRYAVHKLDGDPKCPYWARRC